MQKTVHRLTLRASLAELTHLAEIWQQLAKEHALPSKARWSVQLAAEEVVTNIIVHGYKQQPAQTIDVEIDLCADCLTVVIVDTAPAFDPLKTPPPRLDESLQERMPGGLGIHLMHKLMDRVTYERTEGKNRLTLVKELEPS
jgi:anti-sigma regulatory factor (Ser/Thr protein kinase)